MNNKMKYWKYISIDKEESDFCCIKGEILFHDIGELREFSNRTDFFSLDNK